MLVTKKYQKDDIVSFKLVNGDEIVAKIIEETETEFEISKTCSVMPTQHGIGLMQSLITSEIDRSIMLKKQHVMMVAPTVNDIKNHYIATTTGIEPVAAGGIIV